MKLSVRASHQSALAGVANSKATSDKIRRMTGSPFNPPERLLIEGLAIEKAEKGLGRNQALSPMRIGDHQARASAGAPSRRDRFATVDEYPVDAARELMDVLGGRHVGNLRQVEDDDVRLCPGANDAAVL